MVDNVNTASPTVYYVHSDHLGRPARMTAQNQTWAWDVIYDPFGNVSYSWSNPETMNIRFPGQWFQLESGLAYNWHRHYDATLGRYVRPDPLGLKALMSDGPSAYGYVGGNPLARVDPQGLSISLPSLINATADNCDSKSKQSKNVQLAGTTKNFSKACKLLGVDPVQASDALHDAKHAAGLRPDDNCVFDLDTGDIIFNGEAIGNLHD